MMMMTRAMTTLKVGLAWEEGWEVTLVRELFFSDGARFDQDQNRIVFRMISSNLLIRMVIVTHGI